jgi:hypothetical protein
MIETFLYLAFVGGQILSYFLLRPETGRLDLLYWNACLLLEFKKEGAVETSGIRMVVAARQ